MARRTLLQKYNIPLSYLDFNYVEKCTDDKIMEKIVHILQSGEEGWYPDLTKCAEDKLKELKPNSRFFRREQKIITKDDIENSEWLREGEPIMEWSNEVKLKDNFLSTLANGKTEEFVIPPIRHETKKIDLNKKVESSSSGEQGKMEKITETIASTDYKKWDKFDADTEILKMELDEERNKELTERMNRKNLEKSKESKDNQIMSNEALSRLTNVEKETFSIMCKDRGNEFFKAKEYENSVEEYTKSLEILSSAAGYNNRAVAYLKLLNYSKCVKDCDKCLQIEPKNIKALLRKGQALLEMDKRRDAYDIYSKIISIEPSNIVARNSLNDLKKQLPDLPPSTATRITIQDEDNAKIDLPKNNDKKSALINNNVKNVEVKNNHKEKNVELQNSGVKNHAVKKSSSYNYVQEDLSKLIIPKRVIKNKMVAKTLEAMKNTKTLPNKTDSFDKLNPAGKTSISSEINIPDGSSNHVKKYEKRNLIEEIK